MTRLGPLTSQGLGRSPYDDVFQGEGEADPRQPPQQYDERGRPINPATRQLNRDIIRAHNEVMQVIGVAEPESVVSEPQQKAARQQVMENQVGLRLLAFGRFVAATSAFGVNGLRQRILLYKSFSSASLLGLWTREPRQRSMILTVFLGYPAFTTLIYNSLTAPIFPWILGQPYGRPVYHTLKSWIRLHLLVFAFLQQLNILRPWPLFPNPKFFIPFTSSSPIPPVRPPASFTASEIWRWVGGLALSVAPMLAVYVSQRVAGVIRAEIWHNIRSRLPTPTSYGNHASYRAALREASAAQREARAPFPAVTSAQSTTPPQSPAPQPAPSESMANGEDAEVNAGGFPTTSHMRPRDDFQGQTGTTAEGEGTVAPATGGPTSPRTVRRQSTVSSRARDALNSQPEALYPSDEEDNSGDMVSTTLISFDVEATDATDPPPGQWSAELRPNVAEGSRQDGTLQEDRPARQPKYKSTTLTKLPSGLAADVLAWVPVRYLWAPVDAVVWRWLVRSFLAARGLNTEHVWPLFAFSRGTITNFVGMELLHFFIQFDVWLAMYFAADCFLMTEEEWSEEEKRIAFYT